MKEMKEKITKPLPTYTEYESSESDDDIELTEKQKAKPVKAPKEKVKKEYVMTDARKANFEKARQVRQQNIALKKLQKEAEDNELKQEMEKKLLKKASALKKKVEKKKKVLDDIVSDASEEEEERIIVKKKPKKKVIYLEESSDEEPPVVVKRRKPPQQQQQRPQRQVVEEQEIRKITPIGIQFF